MYYISIRIGGDDLCPAEINRAMGKSGATFLKKGDVVRSAPLRETFVIKEDVWERKTEVSDDRFPQTLEKLIESLYEKKDFLKTLSGKSDISLWVTMYPENVQQNVRLCNKHLKMLSESGIHFDLSVMDLHDFYAGNIK